MQARNTLLTSVVLVALLVVGAVAPAGAAQTDDAPESSTTVDLEPALGVDIEGASVPNSPVSA